MLLFRITYNIAGGGTAILCGKTFVLTGEARHLLRKTTNLQGSSSNIFRIAKEQAQGLLFCYAENGT